MRKILTILLLFATFSAMADERGEKRLERISRYYSSLGSYSLSFVLRAGGGEQRGELQVEGNSSYMKIADTELFVEDSLRYEVRTSTKEIVVDRADAYEKELLNPLSGFSEVSKDYNVEECEVYGCAAVRLTPKRSGETVYIVTNVNGETLSKVKYGSGDNYAEVEIISTKKESKKLPRFSKESYKGFELIDFR